jgi:hypothetical protein
MKVIGIMNKKTPNLSQLGPICKVISKSWTEQSKEKKLEQQLILKPSPKSLNKVDLQTIELIESTIEDIGDDSDVF